MKTFIIAEAGVNHNGSLEMALQLVHSAKKAGAYAVKFQSFKADDIATANAPKAEYQNANDNSAAQIDMLRRLELTDNDFLIIADECRNIGIEFMSTPFSIKAARFLNDLGMRTWKIPSGEITNLPLLRCIASMPGKVIMSTGMATLAEINDAVQILISAGADPSQLYLLHCTTAYPTPYDQVNLRAMQTLTQFNVGGVGYSDHTPGTVVSIAAVAAGAQIIEKHFTVDRNLPGPDHKASITPDMLTRMIQDIRIIEKAMGSDLKQPVEAELTNIPVARKSIVAACPIAIGDIFTETNLTAKRPGTGISPMKWDSLIGKKAKKTYSIDQFIDNSELL